MAVSAEDSTQTKETSVPGLTPERRERIEKAQAFCIEAANLCADLKCDDVKVLDVATVSPMCDFFLIATGGSPRQMRSVAGQIADLAAEHDLYPINPTKRHEGDERWIALDLVDVVAHVLADEAREFYDLDNLWGDAPEVKWFDPDRKRPPTVTTTTVTEPHNS